jgi:hypothetical protein
LEALFLEAEFFDLDSVDFPFLEVFFAFDAFLPLTAEDFFPFERALDFEAPLAFNDGLDFVAVFLPLVADAFFPLERALDPDLAFEPALLFRVVLFFGDLDFDTVFLPLVADVFLPFASVLDLEPVLAFDAVFLPLVAEVFRTFETALGFEPALLFAVLPLVVTLFFALAFVFKDDLALDVLALDAILLPLEAEVFFPLATDLPLLFAVVLLLAVVLPLAALVLEPALATLFLKPVLLLLPALVLAKELFGFDADLTFEFLAFDERFLFLVEVLPFGVLLFKVFLPFKLAFVLKLFLREVVLLVEASLPLEAALDLEIVLPFCAALVFSRDVFALADALLLVAVLAPALVFKAAFELLSFGERPLDLSFEVGAAFDLTPSLLLLADLVSPRPISCSSCAAGPDVDAWDVDCPPDVLAAVASL